VLSFRDSCAIFEVAMLKYCGSHCVSTCQIDNPLPRNLSPYQYLDIR
jgi:hypothetical protein